MARLLPATVPSRSNKRAIALITDTPIYPCFVEDVRWPWYRKDKLADGAGDTKLLRCREGAWPLSTVMLRPFYAFRALGTKFGLRSPLDRACLNLPFHHTLTLRNYSNEILKEQSVSESKEVLFITAVNLKILTWLYFRTRLLKNRIPNGDN